MGKRDCGREYSDVEIRVMKEKVFLSRMRILRRNGFFGILLMRLKYRISPGLVGAVASTDGETVFFNPGDLLRMTDDEIDFTLLHEVMHVALKHPIRMSMIGRADLRAANLAADIIVNSNIIRVFPMFGVISPFYLRRSHRAPDGSEGYLHSLEELYESLRHSNRNPPPPSPSAPLPPSPSADAGGAAGKPEGRPDGKSDGKPDGKSGGSSRDGRPGDDAEADGGEFRRLGLTDSHEKWVVAKIDGDEIDKMLKDAYCAVQRRRESGRDAGTIPEGIERYIEHAGKSVLDWRRMLRSFLEPEVDDYSFHVPDRRFPDGSFIMPSFCDSFPGDEIIRRILFMVDASGSMSDGAISDCIAEIVGAIDEFAGRLDGFLGFFDAKVYDVLPFSDKDDIFGRIPKGGGGTDFAAIFDYVLGMPEEDVPDVLIVLSDGFAPYPKENPLPGTETLWIFNNGSSRDAPFGRTVRIPP